MSYISTNYPIAFASPPKCGNVWMRYATEAAGVVWDKYEFDGDSMAWHVPDYRAVSRHWPHTRVWKITVRRPVDDWLRSYFANVVHKVPGQGQIWEWMQGLPRTAEGFSEFMDRYEPGYAEYQFERFESWADYVVDLDQIAGHVCGILRTHNILSEQALDAVRVYPASNKTRPGALDEQERAEIPCDNLG